MELTFLTFAIVRSSGSSGWIILLSTSSAVAPDQAICTPIISTSTSGKNCLLSRMVEATPIASIRIITRFAAVRWRAKNSIIAENIASLLLFIV